MNLAVSFFPLSRRSASSTHPQPVSSSGSCALPMRRGGQPLPSCCSMAWRSIPNGRPRVPGSRLPGRPASGHSCPLQPPGWVWPGLWAHCGPPDPGGGRQCDCPAVGTASEVFPCPVLAAARCTKPRTALPPSLPGARWAGCQGRVAGDFPTRWRDDSHPVAHAGW